MATKEVSTDATIASVVDRIERRAENSTWFVLIDEMLLQFYRLALAAIIDGDGQMAHPITCQVVFESTCLFPNTMKSSQMVQCNKPSGASGHIFLHRTLTDEM